ncbi:hypothetical protein VOWphi5012_009 [Vibrio phage phi50-12]|uniref:Uncharacterized protein n=1 Tax=Vibrio phage phi50-12 TaxID=2654972 RepID=A0A5P8PR88_9CAUD|nr:hypothetical protein KNU82_gp009 [Vibrio phage phi50-12]QFR59793.1 hypothetical protein VOWphi5012_009 [Vibrio phage phi50-12]
MASDKVPESKAFAIFIALLPTLILGVGGYFGFVQDMTNHHALTDQKVLAQEDTQKKQQAEIEALEKVIQSYMTLPPRVSTLEVTTSELSAHYNRLNVDVEIMKRDLGYVSKGVDSILSKLDEMGKDK